MSAWFSYSENWGKPRLSLYRSYLSIGMQREMELLEALEQVQRKRGSFMDVRLSVKAFRVQKQCLTLSLETN